jgi:hypothetical protein
MTTLGPRDLNNNVICNSLINHITRSIQKKILAAIKRFSFLSNIEISLKITATRKRKQPVMSK